MKNNIRIITIFCIVVIVIITGSIYNTNIKNNINIDKLNVEEAQKEDKIKYKVSSYITPEIKESAIKQVPIICWAYGFDPEYLYNECDNIAIIRTISIDEMTTKPIAYGMTYGKALINNVIYGDLKEEDIITFSKTGGIIDLETLEGNNQKYAIPEGKENTPKNEIYFNIVLEDDYNIEEGKTYLVYLKYIEKLASYQIIGIGRGIRELDIPQEKEYIEKIDIDFSNTKIIKNDNVNEVRDISFNNVQEYIDKYIKIYQ